MPGAESGPVILNTLDLTSLGLYKYPHYSKSADAQFLCHNRKRRQQITSKMGKSEYVLLKGGRNILCRLANLFHTHKDKGTNILFYRYLRVIGLKWNSSLQKKYIEEFIKNV